MKIHIIGSRDANTSKAFELCKLHGVEASPCPEQYFDASTLDHFTNLYGRREPLCLIERDDQKELEFIGDVADLQAFLESMFLFSVKV
jgi:hypothetical protein